MPSRQMLPPTCRPLCGGCLLKFMELLVYLHLLSRTRLLVCTGSGRSLSQPPSPPALATCSSWLGPRAEGLPGQEGHASTMSGLCFDPHSSRPGLICPLVSSSGLSIKLLASRRG